jgi:plasmid stabilization system protein ParE
MDLLRMDMLRKLSKICIFFFFLIVRKLSESCQKVVKKLSKSCQKVSKNSETGRRRRRRIGSRRRRFVAPRPGTTLSHLVKTTKYIRKVYVL